MKVQRGRITGSTFCERPIRRLRVDVQDADLVRPERGCRSPSIIMKPESIWGGPEVA